MTLAQRTRARIEAQRQALRDWRDNKITRDECIARLQAIANQINA